MPETQQRKPQHQDHQPGTRGEMDPQPTDNASGYKGSGRLKGKAALITGGDSGIGRSTAISFAKEGADVCIVYLEESQDAKDAKRLIEAQGVKSLLCQGDIGDEEFCRVAVQKAVEQFGGLDIVVNNAAVQYPEDDVLDIKADCLERTFRTNIFAVFYLVQAALPHLRKEGCIINTASITAFAGQPILIDYSSTKGAIVSFTRSLAKSLVKKGIRVNAVAPGPVWTPLIPSSFDAEQVAKFGSDNPMGRAAKADEISPAFVFLASADSRFMTGQVLHVNGGEHFG
ncbi:MAG TPA: SDR family oxidoreductase [Alphaproteobacteria bacterium]|jgi:NAD(P)-dependent dehydrogenase (short-subunit alcohol dehydrogenase family)